MIPGVRATVAFSVQGAFNHSAEIEDSARYKNLRLATVNNSQSNTPQSNAQSMASDHSWIASSPEAFVPGAYVGGGAVSAVCYFFGRALYVGLHEQVPIGLISSSIGGVKIETMASADALSDDTCGGTRADAPTTPRTSPAAEPFPGASGLSLSYSFVRSFVLRPSHTHSLFSPSLPLLSLCVPFVLRLSGKGCGMRWCIRF